MNKLLLAKLLSIFVAISGCFSVLFGAWLAHKGQDLSLVTQHRLATALQYQFIHSLALLAVLVWFNQTQCKRLLASASGFALGICLFCGSLYIKSLVATELATPLAPVGGISFALAWLMLLAVPFKHQENH